MEASIAGGNGFNVFWNKDTEGIFPPDIKTSDGRVLNKGAIDVKSAEIKASGKGVVTDLSKAKKAADRPQLYDITELQRDANRKYGYTAAVTLATAQALYETQKVLSYPRTDSRYITQDLVPYMAERVRMIGTLNKYKTVAADLTAAGLNINKKIVDDSKVTDHHALIPTKIIDGFNLTSMKPTDEEKKKGVTVDTMNNILDLVLTRVLVSFSTTFTYEQTDITVTFSNGMKFTASGKKPVSFGWKEVQRILSGKGEIGENTEGDSPEQLFPNIQKGQSVIVKDCKTIAGKTSPPKLHTEATLLTAMENAGQQIENGAILKGKGIGKSNRAEIIKKLYDTEVVETELKGKTPYIKPTKKGLTIIRILPPDLYSPKITADWETKIAEIVEGRETESNVMLGFESYIIAKTEQVKSMTVQASFAKEKESFGACPWCGKPVYCFQEKNAKGKVTETRYYCSEKCDWGMKTNDMTFIARLGRNITDAEAKKLIVKKFIVLECTTKSGGSKYRGEFTFRERISSGKRYCNIKCEPVKTTKKK